ncbi:MAG: cysteine--tRNA ligase [candidate division Zixibacteria bacterium]|nr:cysteine--tRNA ligase [Candidatus Tariuqbacter arcticus]
MPLTLHNTLTRRTEEFIPLNPGEVKIYTCGPTIYGYAHIGNFRAYIFEDLLRRYLKYKGFKVTQVMNITDVDDKTIRDSQKAGVPLSDYTAEYKRAFFSDRDALNIEPAEYYPAATGHIPEMLALIEKLRDKGFTYQSEGSIYFRISSFPEYGRLSGMSFESLKTGARIDADEYEKEEARDFVLWKARRPEDGDVFWDSQFGQGRPGWHLECSAMSMKYLGETFDIHCGGEDNIFPHHENEIAQSQAATGKKFVHYWLHCGYLLVEGRKMAKSMGNFYTLKDLMDKGYDPLAVRYTLLSTHYRQQLNFTFDSLEASAAALKRLQDFITALASVKKTGECHQIENLIAKARSEFEASLDDDLNIAPALGAIFTMVKEANRLIADGEMTIAGAVKILQFLKSIDTVLGALDFSQPESDAEIEELIYLRNEARSNKNWNEADRIRDKLTEIGILLEDTADGTRWKKVK